MDIAEDIQQLMDHVQQDFIKKVCLKENSLLISLMVNFQCLKDFMKEALVFKRLKLQVFKKKLLKLD